MSYGGERSGGEGSGEERREEGGNSKKEGKREGGGTLWSVPFSRKEGGRPLPLLAKREGERDTVVSRMACWRYGTLAKL